jgi:hypothetical protein
MYNREHTGISSPWPRSVAISVYSPSALMYDTFRKSQHQAPLLATIGITVDGNKTDASLWHLNRQRLWSWISPSYRSSRSKINFSLFSFPPLSAATLQGSECYEDRRRIAARDLGRSRRHLIEGRIFWYSPGWTEENHEEPEYQDSRYPNRDSNRGHDALCTLLML